MDFLAECESGPARRIRALSAVVKAAPGAYLDLDTGGAAWAACELVALSYGYGDPSEVDDAVLELLGRLKPKEELR
jgi:hypothetical protein